MNIVVFGATGMIGTRIAAELEQRGHAVTAATRATGADVTDPPSVASVAAGADAVVSAVSARGMNYTLADVAPALVEGVREAGVRRLLVVGGAGFVGANLVRRTLREEAASVTVVDNLLSAERWAVPDDPRVTFLEGSIADDALEHVLVAAFGVAAVGADLDLGVQQRRVGVDDQGAELAADLEHDVLVVRPVRLGVVVHMRVVVIVPVTVVVSVHLSSWARRRSGGAAPPERRGVARC